MADIQAQIVKNTITVEVKPTGISLEKALTFFYTEEEIDGLLANYALSSHLHDDRYFTEDEVTALLNGKAEAVHNHDERYFTEAEVTIALDGKSNTGHTHDDRYYTETEIDSQMATKSDTTHLHDTRYYTETEIDSLIGGYYTEGEVDTLLAGKAPLVHNHNDLYFTESEVTTLLAGKENTLTAGTGSQYYRGDKQWATLNTTAVAEGTNLYFTNTRADARITAQKGQANGLATLGADSKIPTAQLPALAITNTNVVANESAMLALTAEIGDVAIRSDLNKTYILQAEPASTLANWKEILTPASPVQSVNTQTGNVVLTTSDIAEGTNLYYTQARFDTAFGAKSTDNLTEGATNLFFTNERVDDRVASLVNAGAGITKSYDDVNGTLTIASSITQYTDEMVDDRVNSLIVAGAGITANYNDVANTLTISASVQSVNTHTGVVSLDSDDIGEGSTNLYWTQTRFNTAFGLKSTTDLAEGTKLFWTQSRFDTAFGAKSTTNLAEGTNLYYTQGRFDTAFGAKNSDALAEGVTNRYFTDERVQDVVASMLTEGSNITLTYNDTTGALTIDASVTGGANALDDLSDVVITTPANGHVLQHNGTNFINRTLADAGIAPLVHNHDDLYFTEAEVTTLLSGKADTSHTQASSTITDFAEAVDDRVGALLTQGAGISLTYNDAGNALTIASSITQYTDELAQDAVASMIQNGTGITWAYNDASGTLTPTIALTPFSTTNLAEGTNLYYTDARFNTAFSGKSTTDLAEGTNLYFTNERVDDRVNALLQAGANITLTYDDVANTLTIASTASGGGTPAGTDTHVQFNDDGAFGASSDFRYDATAKKLFVNNAIEINNSDSVGLPISLYIKNAVASEGMRFEQNAVMGGGKSFLAIYSNQAHVNGDAYLWKFENVNTGATQPATRWINKSSAELFSIRNEGNSRHIVATSHNAGGDAGLIWHNFEVASATGHHIKLLNNGSDVFWIEADGDITTYGGAVFNEGGLAKDFRVEGDNDTHLLYVDGTNGVVMINESNWDSWAKFIVNGGTRFNDDFRFQKGVGSQNVARLGGTGYDLNFEAGNTSLFKLYGSGAVTFGEGAGFTGAVFNESGADADIRMEGDTDANLFFLDASTNRIGIGKNNPAYKLDVTGDINVTGAFYINGVEFTGGSGGGLTQEEVDDRIVALLLETGGIYETYDDTGNTLKLSTVKTGSLTDGATIAIDASLGNLFDVTLAGNRTLGAPTNPQYDGQEITLRVRQDATGGRTLAYNAIYRFGTDVANGTLSLAPSKMDYIKLRYNSTDTKWDVISVARGY